MHEKYKTVLALFEAQNPTPETELHYRSDFQLLIAVMLSAQCTDKRVNQVTPTLFEHYPTAEKMAEASFDDVFRLIKSISYPNSKTDYLIGSAQRIVQHYHGKVPDTLEALTSLPGVGRKTANVILSVLHQQATMAVDTHVFRVAHLLGLVSPKENTPLRVEKKLTRYIPQALIHKAHHWLILHGRYTCIARKPLCERCFLTAYCSAFSKKYPKKK